MERGLARAFVSLGNGLVQDRIAAIVGEENLVVGTVEWGATNLGAGHLARTTRARRDSSVTNLRADALVLDWFRVRTTIGVRSPRSPAQNRWMRPQASVSTASEVA